MTTKKVTSKTNGAKRSAKNHKNGPSADTVVRLAVKEMRKRADAATANGAELQQMRERVEKLESESEKAYESAVRHVTSVVGEYLVRACDALGGEIAEYARQDNISVEALGNVTDALLSLYQARWELGMTTSSVTLATVRIIELMKAVTSM